MLGQFESIEIGIEWLGSILIPLHIPIYINTGVYIVEQLWFVPPCVFDFLPQLVKESPNFLPHVVKLESK